jgi:hypothetical protein
MHRAIQVHTPPSPPSQSHAKNRASNPFIPHTYEGRARKPFIYGTYVNTREYTPQKRKPGEAIPPVATAASSSDGVTCSLSSTLRYPDSASPIRLM